MGGVWWRWWAGGGGGGVRETGCIGLAVLFLYVFRLPSRGFCLLHC